jgi:hypothetical protein
MQENLIKELKNIFLISNSSDELFDAFSLTIKARIREPELYRTLLWNKTLSPEEISMYAEKICREFPDLAFKIYSWVGEIFASISSYGTHHEKAYEYLLKAAEADKKSREPLIAITKLYNKELNIPSFSKVVEAAESGIGVVELKSKLCFAISQLYKRTGNFIKGRDYQRLGERYQREGK